MVSYSEKIYRANSPTDNINVDIRMDDLCVRDNSNPANSFIPNNGEYELGNNSGSCYFCLGCEPNNMDASSGCAGPGLQNCTGGTGSHPTYHRTAYKADVDSCCITSNKIIGDLTCDPKYNGGASADACSTTFNNVCNGALLNSTSCIAWGAKQDNTTLYNIRARSYCKDNLNSKWCRDKMVEIGGIDSNVADFCKLYPDDPFCSCSTALVASSTENMDPDIQASLARPECFVKGCSSGSAYKLANMRTSGNCPSIQICSNKIDVNGNAAITLTNIQQNCTQTQSGANANATALDNTSAIKPAVATTTIIPPVTLLDKIKYNWNNLSEGMQFLFMFIIIIVILLGITSISSLIADDDSGDFGSNINKTTLEPSSPGVPHIIITPSSPEL